MMSNSNIENLIAAQLDAVVREVADTEGVGAISQGSGSNGNDPETGERALRQSAPGDRCGNRRCLAGFFVISAREYGPQHRAGYRGERNADLDRRNAVRC